MMEPSRMLRASRRLAELMAAMVEATHEGLAVANGTANGYELNQRRTSIMKWAALAAGGRAVGLLATEAANGTNGAKASRKAAECSYRATKVKGEATAHAKRS